MGRLADRVNPVAVALGPVQVILAQAVVPLRKIRYLFFWQDRFLTTWLCLGLIVFFFISLLMPWSFLVYYGARIAGAALLGPQMHLLGTSIDAGRTGWLAEVRRYHEATASVKEELIGKYRSTLMEEAKAKVHAAKIKQASRSKIELERAQYLEHQQFNFLNGNTRGNANCKFIATADPSCSSAWPLRAP